MERRWLTEKELQILPPVCNEKPSSSSSTAAVAATVECTHKVCVCMRFVVILNKQRKWEGRRKSFVLITTSGRTDVTRNRFTSASRSHANEKRRNGRQSYHRNTLSLSRFKTHTNLHTYKAWHVILSWKASSLWCLPLSNEREREIICKKRQSCTYTHIVERKKTANSL